jgi:plastocyanin
MTRAPRLSAVAMSAYSVVLLLVALGLAPLLSDPAAAATTVTIRLTAKGPQPAALTVAAGTTVAFQNVDATFVHGARNAQTGAAWTFNTGTLAPGQVRTAATLTKPGEYVYQSNHPELGDVFSGKVVVPGGSSPAPSPLRSAAPVGSVASAQASPAVSGAAAASPSPAGGSGAAGAPTLGAFGSEGLPVPTPSSGAPAPQVAPAQPGAALGGVTPVPTPSPASTPVVALARRLPAAATARHFGLPAALAAVAVVGVASLLARLLLAHPAARRRRPPDAAMSSST